MRHWLWFKSSGEIGGDLTVASGWDAGLDFTDAGSTDPEVQYHRDQALLSGGTVGYTNLTDFAGFIAYDCPCDPEIVWCHHAAEQVGQSKVSGGSLVARPLPKIMVDGVEINHDATVDKTPGAIVTLQLQEVVASDMPNGVVYNATNLNGAEVLQTSPTALTYTGGVTNTINMTAPAQGSVGMVSLKPAIMVEGRACRFRIRGWA